ncbi:interleukin-17C-like isoform X2 [Siniperca chuatsi]|uniref:interleukin-17C-like isoform X2 n=1 Tax=Siniperca chuatsi TaxID=119488 RepID=UPI001CE1A708|nr:interleukin-17C-like isoform X2 [Siniperca chuatsi]
MARIFLGSLLIFNEQTTSSAGSSRCISEAQFNNRADRFRDSYWGKWSVSKNLVPERDTRTCAQAAKEMHGDPSNLINNRSLSPWRYSLDRDVDRIPHDIAIAECLCQGCIINQREELSYNSVPVFATLMVLRKTLCVHDPNKYDVKKVFIRVPVACTCVVPKYTK